MISPDSITRKSCGERFDLIESDFVVLAETIRKKDFLLWKPRSANALIHSLVPK